MKYQNSEKKNDSFFRVQSDYADVFLWFSMDFWVVFFDYYFYY